MAKLTFIAGLAAGYVLGARAGRKRYEQIKRTSGKVWNSGPVQKQVGNAKEVARTKAAPVVADMVADAARATGEKLRSSRTVTGRDDRDHAGIPRVGDGTSPSGRRTGHRQRRGPVGGGDAAPTAPPEPLLPGGLRRPRPSSPGARTAHRPRRTSAPPAVPGPAWPVPWGGTSSRAPRLPGPVPRRPLVPTPGRPHP